MKIRSSILTYLLFFISFSIAFAGGYLVHVQVSRSQQEFSLLKQAYNILENHALEELPEDPAIEYGMIRGMLQAYSDPNTIFVEPVEHELSSDNLEGSFGGIGVRISRDDQANFIIFPFPDSPSEKAGLMEGDQIISVDDLDITPDLDMSTLQASIRGPVGKSVRISIIRPPDEQIYTVHIVRTSISIPSVTWHPLLEEPRVGLIEINIIAASTPDEIQKAVRELQDRGVTHFILDLRDNRGGLLNSGVEITRLFLKEGKILQEQYRGKPIKTYHVTKSGPLAEIPLAVFVNANTASAAEIIAGAIKAQNRATVIGTHTFGKDTIQLVFDLNDGSSLHVTAAKWWIPDLDPLSKGGLEPNILVTGNQSQTEEYIDTAVEVLLQNE
jgi:carboxyl-terminal processing protease